jgi:RES domain-containing protein
MIEALVHLELDETDWPQGYQLTQVEFPDGLSIETLKPIPAKTWKKSLTATRALGDEWLRARRSALARIPSVILPETWNLLLNPEHRDAKQVRIVKAIHAEYDPRLLPGAERRK